MATVNHCNLPDDLHYLVEKHVWARPEDGVVVVGLTDVAQSLAKGIISVTLKKTGRKLAKGKSLGTVESGKWVGPVPAPVAGEIAPGGPQPTGSLCFAPTAFSARMTRPAIASSVPA